MLCLRREKSAHFPCALVSLSQGPAAVPRRKLSARDIGDEVEGKNPPQEMGAAAGVES